MDGFDIAFDFGFQIRVQVLWGTIITSRTQKWLPLDSCFPIFQLLLQFVSSSGKLFEVFRRVQICSDPFGPVLGAFGYVWMHLDALRCIWSIPQNEISNFCDCSVLILQRFFF